MVKPRLFFPAPWTPEDTGIWLRWAQRHGWHVYACFLGNVQTVEFGDRRDAHLMLALRVQAEMGPCYLRIGADNYAVPAIQVHVRRNPLFPTGAGYPFNITPAHKGQ
jgi:hypothetical protein